VFAGFAYKSPMGVWKINERVFHMGSKYRWVKKRLKGSIFGLKSASCGPFLAGMGPKIGYFELQ
jgi:hypothetical protein